MPRRTRSGARGAVMAHLSGAAVWTRNPMIRTRPFNWKLLCPSGGYRDHIRAQVAEICERYPVVDGFWFDIYQVHEGCWCDRCRASMTEKGVDMDDDEAVIAHFAEVYKAQMAELRATIAVYHPQATVYFNGTTAFGRGNQAYGTHIYNTHQDLEDLPTGWGGYDKFPLRARYYQGEGYQICAMSGKFHTAWGEFGGYKHPDALRYEAASMIAFGAVCNFGDQLHPSGLMEMETYRNIGRAFEYVERIEAYGAGGTTRIQSGNVVHRKCRRGHRHEPDAAGAADGIPRGERCQPCHLPDGHHSQPSQPERYRRRCPTGLCGFRWEPARSF